MDELLTIDWNETLASAKGQTPLGMLSRVLLMTGALLTRPIASNSVGASSDNCILKFGILQGSYLGPLFFKLYINNFENCLENMTPNVYAHDTCVSIASESLNELLRG